VRTSLVLLYWADRLDGVVCTARGDVVAGLDLALGPLAHSRALDMPEPRRIDEAQGARDMIVDDLAQRWASVRRLSRRRSWKKLEDVSYALTGLAEALGHASEPRSWRLTLGGGSVPDPALLIRRVLNGQDPEREPPLPRTRIRRRPLCLLAAS
jgi:hypothetical protein